jgi:cytochrome bd-type quinol oxidase subunit 2
MKIKKIYLYLLTWLVWPTAGLAASTLDSKFTGEMSDFKSASGLTYQTPESVVGNLINAFLGFLGIIFIVLIVYGGFTWMTAQGNEEKIAKAKKMIGNATVGLLITLLSYFITAFVIDALEKSGL